MLCDSTTTTTVVIVVATLTQENQFNGFPLFSYMGMGLRLAALQAAGAPL